MDNEHDNQTSDFKQALSPVLGTFLDLMIQVLSVQLALVDAKILTMDRVQMYVDRLNLLPEVLKARSAYGPRSEVIDSLLRSYEGPLQ